MVPHDPMMPARLVQKIPLSPSCGLVRIKPVAELPEVAVGQTVNVTLQAQPDRKRVSSFTVLRAHEDGDISLLVRRSSNGGVSDGLLSEQCSDIWIGHPLPSPLASPNSPEGPVLCLVAGTGASAIGAVVDSGLLSQSDIVFVGRDEDCELLPDCVLRYVSDGREAPRNSKVWNTTILGRPQQSNIEELIGGKTRYRSIIVCGPAAFCALVGDACRQMGLEDSQLLVESFGGEPHAEKYGADGGTSLAVIDLFGKTQVVSWPANQNLVTAMLNAGIEAPYSCQVGICSTCQCSILIGDAEMQLDLGLSEEEKDAGLSLACQLRPISPALAIRFATAG